MTNNPVSRRWFLEQMGVTAALALTPHWSRGADSLPAKKLGVALVGLGGYSTGQLGPALRETKFCQIAGAGEMGRRDLAIIEAIYRASASGHREAVKAS
jgi:hypothetical protein